MTDTPQKRTMAILYETIEDWDAETKKEIWDRWLWASDCNAKPLEQCWDMNEMHTLGVLCLIRESVAPVPSKYMTITEITGEEPDIAIIHLNDEKKIEEYSLREVLDQLECLQLNFGKVMSAIPPEKSLQLLLALMARLGTITHHMYELEGEVLDDPQHVTTIPTNENNDDSTLQSCPLAAISRKSLRQSICIFCILFRIHSIVSRVKEIEENDEEKRLKIISTLKTHHIESSIDFFNHFQQMVYLAPAMRLVYRTNFSGMYNDVSQVIYFHFPRFARQPQIPLSDIPSSNCHMLPLISQIMPDIPVFYEDDSVIPGLTTDLEMIKKHNYENLEWAWLVCCSEIFLIEIISHTNCSENNIYIATSRSLTDLISILLKKTNRKIGDESLDTEGVDVILKHGISMTAHGHLQIIDEKKP